MSFVKTRSSRLPRTRPPPVAPVVHSHHSGEGGQCLGLSSVAGSKTTASQRPRRGSLAAKQEGLPRGEKACLEVETLSRKVCRGHDQSYRALLRARIYFLSTQESRSKWVWGVRSLRPRPRPLLISRVAPYRHLTGLCARPAHAASLRLPASVASPARVSSGSDCEHASFGPARYYVGNLARISHLCFQQACRHAGMAED